MQSPRFFTALPALLWFTGLLCLLAISAHGQTASQLYSDAVQTYNAGDVASAKRKLQLTLEVDKNFRPASALLSRINLVEQQAKAGAPGGAGAAPLSVKALERVSFPVEFKGTTLTAALEFVRQQVETTTGGKTEVNFVLQLPPDLANKKITLQLSHVPVTEMLRYLGELGGVSFQMQKFAILVTPATTAPTESTVPAAAAPTP